MGSRYRWYFMAGAAIAAFVAAGIIVLSRPHSSPARAALSPAKVDSNPMHTAAARGFAADVQAISNAASKKYKDGYHMRNVTCVQGGPQDFVCAFMLKIPTGQNECHVARVHRGPTGIEPVAAGRVNLPAARCTALNAFKAV